MDRKAALLSCQNGQWIRTEGMRELRLNANVKPETQLEIQQLTESPDGQLFTKLVVCGPGRHPLSQASWTKVCIIDGPWLNALCSLEAA